MVKAIEISLRPPNAQRPNRWARVLIAVGLTALAAGCNSYKANFANEYEMGRYPQSEQTLRAEADGALESSSNGDHLIYSLELGTVQRTLNEVDASEKSFDASWAYFAKVDQQADLRIGRAAKAAVSNLAELAYEGYGYDRIMLGTYQALNYLQQGNNDFARAELKRVANAQQQIAQTKAAKMKQLQAEGAQSKNFNPQAVNDPSIQRQTASLYSDIPENTVRAAYLNAFSEYLQGIFYLHAGDADDQEVGRAALRSALNMNASPYIQQDLDWLDLPPEQRPKVTYVIFESGMAPRREEIRIDIPVWVFNLVVHDTGVDYVGVAFPKLVPIPEQMDYVQSVTANGTYPTQMIVNMDGVVAREFKDELPTVITRTFIAAGAKAALAYAANYATRNEGLLNLATRIATTAYQYTVNRADLRTWRTLPKTINMARFVTPADGRVTITSPGAGTLANVQVDPQQNNIIWLRAPGGAATVVCRTFVVKPNR